MLPLLECRDLEDDDKIFGESYDSEEETEQSDGGEIQVQEYGSEAGESHANHNIVGAISGPSGNELGSHTGTLLKNLSKNSAGAMSVEAFENMRVKQEQDEQFRKTYEQYIEH